jgi:hypothetical protein
MDFVERFDGFQLNQHQIVNEQIREEVSNEDAVLIDRDGMLLAYS